MRDARAIRDAGATVRSIRDRRIRAKVATATAVLRESLALVGRAVLRVGLEGPVCRAALREDLGDLAVLGLCLDLVDPGSVDLAACLDLVVCLCPVVLVCRVCRADLVACRVDPCPDLECRVDLGRQVMEVALPAYTSLL